MLSLIDSRRRQAMTDSQHRFPLSREVVVTNGSNDVLAQR
jgi:hypothetical protein